MAIVVCIIGCKGTTLWITVYTTCWTKYRVPYQLVPDNSRVVTYHLGVFWLQQIKTATPP